MNKAVDSVLTTKQDSYDVFIQRINDRYNGLTGPVFETDAVGLYEAYLASFPEGAERQYHTCSCCKQFIERFGALAAVKDDGTLSPVMWDVSEAPDHYKRAVETMNRLVRRAKITKPFISSERQYGTAKSTVPSTGHIWTHFAVRPAEVRVFKGGPLKNAFQLASEKREELASVMQALSEYNKETVGTALTLLKNDQLGNAAAAVGQAQFLADLHNIEASEPLRRNLVFRAVAVAPSGLCHPRSSMIATLLDDIAAGKTFEQAQAAWNAKMHPLQYQRPQAAPSAGNIAQAEKMFQELGLAPALQRRIARFDEVPKLWEPKPAKQQDTGAGVFAHLAPKTAAAVGMEAPAIAITLEKFVRTVIPTADNIQVLLSGHMPFIAITTAVEPDAPKLFQWDHSFAWYVWHGGAPASQYGMSVGWADVSGLTRMPARWNDEGAQKFAHHGDGLIFILKDARETRVAGAALFPSCLRSELREVRATIEAYSSKATMSGLTDGSAVGIDLRAGGSELSVMVRVTSEGRRQAYKIDRWD